MCTVYSFPREGVGNKMCTMCTDYSFPREGVGQQDVYNVYSVQFFFWSVSCKSEGKGAWERVNIIYIFIIYIII